MATVPAGTVGPQFDPLEYASGAAGTAEGRGRVKDGQFNYDMPLVLPPGRANMTPGLRLEYASSGGNGLLGVGWTLAGGISQVHQCYKNLARDGEVRGITSSQSAFCLDGQLLVATEESPPVTDALPQLNPSATTTVYRTEHDRNLRIVGSQWWEPNAVEATRRWVVMHPDGLVDIYGEGQAEGRGIAQADGPDWTLANGPRWYQGDSKALSWYRNERRDRSGNRIQYHYERDVVVGPDELGAFHPSGVPTETASRVLTRITYGHAMSGPGVQPREVRFEYESRPDILESWRATIPLVTNVRLRRVRMMAPETNVAPLDTVRTYELDYIQSARSGRSLVASVSTCDGTGICLPTTEFDYPEPTYDAGFELEVIGALDKPLTGEDVVADFDGDGSDDLLRPDTGGTFETLHWDPANVYGSSPTLRIEPTAVPYDEMVVAPDLDGDGLPEIVKGGISSTNNILAVFKRTSGATSFALDELLTSSWTSAGFKALLAGDLDGDGRHDLIAEYASGELGARVSGHSQNVDLIHPATTAKGERPTIFDYDGDGRANVFAIDQTSFGGSVNGHGFQLAPENLGALPYGEDPIYLDLNGDGMRDVMFPTEGKTCIHVGYGFNWTCRDLPGALTRHDEIRDQSVDSWCTRSSNNREYCYASVTSDYLLNTFLPADFNGDGKDDILKITRQRSFIGQGAQSHQTRTVSVSLYINRWDGYWQTGAPPFSQVSQYGNGHLQLQTTNQGGAVLGMLGDVDGDRRPDLLMSNGEPNGDFVFGLPRQDPNHFVDRIVGVQNGLGFVDEIEYRPFHPQTSAPDDVIHAPDANCSYPVRCLRRGPPLVARHTQRSAGISPSDPETVRARQYSYAGARLDLRGRGHLGFREIVQTDHDAVTTVTTSFDQTAQTTSSGYTVYPGVGRPHSITSTVELGSAHTVTTTRSATYHDILNEGWYVSRLTGQQQTVSEWLTQGVYQRTTSTAFQEFDPYSFPTVVTRTDAVGRVTTTKRVFDHRPSDWLLGLVDEVDVRIIDGAEERRIVTSQQHDARGLLTTRHVLPDNETGLDPTRERIVTMGYTSWGMLTSLTDHDVAHATSRTSTITYDATGIFPTAIINPLGHAVQMQSDGRTGRTVRTMDQACAVAENHVDLFGRTVASFAADGSSETFEYLRSAVLTDPETMLSPFIVHRTGGDGSELFLYSDSTGRVLAGDSRSFGDDFVRNERELDALGRPSRTLAPRAATPLRVADKSTTTFFEREYDNLNRIVVLRRPGDTGPSGPKDMWEYPRLEERRHTDRVGRVTTHTHNKAGELVSIARSGRTTTITYDPTGLAKRIDAPGFVETRRHDGLGRLLDLSSTDRGTFSYGYDAYGRMRTEVTPEQFTRVITYDALDRPSTLLHELGSDQWTWDTQYDGTLSSALSSDGISTLYGYDSLGRLASETITGDGDTRSVHLAYDAIGQLSRLTYPATPGGYQLEIEYGYQRGSLRDIIDVGREKKIWTTLAHDLHGRTTGFQLGADADALTVASSYDDTFGRLKVLEAFRASAPTFKILNQHHTLHADGRLKQRRDSSEELGGALNRVEDYSYDTFGRLETWKLNRDGGPVDLERRYIYDGQLMRLNRVEDTLGGASSPTSVEVYNYADATGHPNRLLSVGGPGYAMQYDALGRMTSRERGGGLGPDDLDVASYTYHDLPRHGEVGGTSFDIGYTVDGTRANVQWGSGASTHYHGKLTEIRKVPGKTTYIHRVYGEHGVAAQFEVLDSAKPGDEPAISYVVNDHLGSPAIVETPGTTVVARQFFEPHGRRVAENGAPLLPGQDGGVTEGLTGHEHNLELGLINMLGRTYDPVLRRFASPDPVLDNALEGMGVDLYRHVANDPVNRTDPTGYLDLDDIAIPDLGPDDFGPIGGGTDSSGPGPDPYGAGYDDPSPPDAGYGAGDWGVQPNGVATPNPDSFEPFGPFPAAPPAPGNGTSAPTPPSTQWSTASLTGDPVDWLLAHPEGAIYGGIAAAATAAACFFGGCAAVAAAAESAAASTPAVTVTSTVAAGARRFSGPLQRFGARAVNLLQTGHRIIMRRGPLCFVPGTLVLMADGTTKPIEDIEEGDLVLGDDPYDKEAPGAYLVTAVHKNATYRVFSIDVGSKDGGTIEATGRHPFFTQRGWVAAEELLEDDLLLDPEENGVSIMSIAVESRDSATFNLTVEGAHTFYVVAGSTPVLVHNVDAWDILFTQQNYGATFTHGPYAGRTLVSVAAEARQLGRLPDGLTLEAVRMGDGSWATLNNRTLAVARMANLHVNPVDAGAKGTNRLVRLLREANLSGPVRDAVMRCK